MQKMAPTPQLRGPKMATTILPKALRLSSPFPFPFPFPLHHPPAISPPRKTHHPPPPRAADDDSKPPSDEPPADSSFENRLAKVRLKYRSGTGKKAEIRKAKKSGGSTKKKGGGVMLPPVALKKAVSAGGMEVELGFSRYSEWLNGRLAGLGLLALVLVELGSGKGLFAYHSSGVVFVQIYTVAAAAAVFVKYEKERISVWPEKEAVGGGD